MKKKLNYYFRFTATAFLRLSSYCDSGDDMLVANGDVIPNPLSFSFIFEETRKVLTVFEWKTKYF